MTVPPITDTCPFTLWCCLSSCQDSLCLHSLNLGLTFHLGQWDINRCDESRGLKSIHSVGLLLFGFLLEPWTTKGRSPGWAVETLCCNMWPVCQPAPPVPHVSEAILDHPAPVSLPDTCSHGSGPRQLQQNFPVKPSPEGRPTEWWATKIAYCVKPPFFMIVCYAVTKTPGRC